MPTAAEARIAITDDLFLRVSSMPAGTARHALSHSILKRHGSHRIFMFSNKLADCVALSNEVELVYEAGKRNINLSRHGDAAALAVDPRLQYHMGATYLLGGNQSRAEFKSAEMLGHLGSVVFHLYKNSSLAKSPHIAVKTGATWTTHYDSSDCYTQEWDEICKGLAAALIVTKSDLINTVCGVSNDARVERKTWIDFQVLIGAFPNRNAAGEAYDSFDPIFDKFRGAGGQGARDGGAGEQGEEL